MTIATKQEIAVTGKMLACQAAAKELRHLDQEARMGRGNRDARDAARKSLSDAIENLDCWLVINADVDNAIQSVHTTRHDAHNALATETNEFRKSIYHKTGGFIHRYIVAFDGSNEWE